MSIAAPFIEAIAAKLDLAAPLPRLHLGVVKTPITPFVSRTGLRDHVFASCAVLEGGAGFGHVLHMQKEPAEAAVRAAARLLSTSRKLGAMLDIENAAADEDESAASNAAACMLSTTAWDFAGRALETPCAALWGGATSPLQCYSSYHLAFADDDALESAAERCFQDGFRRAKMTVGARSLEDDLRRVSLMQWRFGEEGVAADALQRWRPEQAHAFCEALPTKLMWLEDPAPYADLAELRVAHPIAAGEACASADELHALYASGARYMLTDVGLVGGPMRHLSISRALAARGARIGSHAYPYVSAHLLACAADPLPVEVLDWSDALYHAPPRPNGDGLLSVTSPGFGVTPDMSFLRAAGLPV